MNHCLFSLLDVLANITVLEFTFFCIAFLLNLAKPLSGLGAVPN